MDRDITPRGAAVAGLTLVELLATLGAALVILGIGVPGFLGLVDGQRVIGRSHTLVAHLQLARSEAVKRGRRVALCPSTDHATCRDGYDWSAGWLVFVDRNRDRERQADEPLLRVGDASAPLRVITSTGRRRVVYEADGSVLGGSNATFRICSASAARRNRAVVVSMTGRPRTTDRDAANRPVQCS